MMAADCPVFFRSSFPPVFGPALPRLTAADEPTPRQRLVRGDHLHFLLSSCRTTPVRTWWTAW